MRNLTNLVCVKIDHISPILDIVVNLLGEFFLNAKHKDEWRIHTVQQYLW